MFRLGIYLCVYSDEQENIQKTETELRSILESKLIYIKPTLYQQPEGFVTVYPMAWTRSRRTRR